MYGRGFMAARKFIQGDEKIVIEMLENIILNIRGWNNGQT